MENYGIFISTISIGCEFGWQLTEDRYTDDQTMDEPLGPICSTSFDIALPMNALLIKHADMENAHKIFK